MNLKFTKMHGAGNDFVIVDCRLAPLALDAAQIARLGDRHFGVGFDQLLTIEPARDPSCAFAYGIYNADGSLARQCGNGLRCVAAWLYRAGAVGTGDLQLQSPSGPVSITVGADGSVRAGMGQARFAPDDIPLRRKSLHDFATYLRDELPRVGTIEIFACWDGDQEAPPEHHRGLTPSAFETETFFFLQKELSTIRPDAG